MNRDDAREMSEHVRSVVRVCEFSLEQRAKIITYFSGAATVCLLCRALLRGEFHPVVLLGAPHLSQSHTDNPAAHRTANTSQDKHTHTSTLVQAVRFPSRHAHCVRHCQFHPFCSHTNTSLRKRCCSRRPPGSEPLQQGRRPPRRAAAAAAAAPWAAGSTLRACQSRL